MYDARLSELEGTASAAQGIGDWPTAYRAYREILDCELSRLDRAKTLANLMQCAAKVGLNEESEKAGEECLRLIGTDPPWRSNEEAMISGVVKGHLARLRGHGIDWRGPLSLLTSYSIGAAIGAAIGSRIEFQGFTAFGTAWTDLRYGGAGLGAILGFLLLTRLVYHFPMSLIALGALAGIFQSVWIVTESDLEKGLATLGILTIPIMLFAMKAMGTRSTHE